MIKLKTMYIKNTNNIKFQLGDTVVKNSNFPYFMVKGFEYKVLNVRDDGFLQIEGSEKHYLSPDLFDLVGRLNDEKYKKLLNIKQKQIELEKKKTWKPLSKDTELEIGARVRPKNSRLGEEGEILSKKFNHGWDVCMCMSGDDFYTYDELEAFIV